MCSIIMPGSWLAFVATIMMAQYLAFSPAMRMIYGLVHLTSPSYNGGSRFQLWLGMWCVCICSRSLISLRCVVVFYELTVSFIADLVVPLGNKAFM